MEYNARRSAKFKPNFGPGNRGKRPTGRRGSAREYVADGRDQAGEGASVVGSAQRPETAARIAQLFAPAQERVLHLPVAERARADKPLAAHIGAAAVRLHQGE